MKRVKPYLILYQAIRQNKPVGEQSKNPYVRKNKSDLIYIIVRKCKEHEKRQYINSNDLIDHKNNEDIAIGRRRNIEEPSEKF